MAIKRKTHSGAKARFKVKGKKKSQGGKGLTIEKASSMHNHRMHGKSTRTKKRRQDNDKLHKADFKKILTMLCK